MIVLKGNHVCPRRFGGTSDRTTCDLSATSKPTCTLKYENAREAFSEKNRSHHQAVQARRGERSAPGSRTARHHRERSQGVQATEGTRRTLSRSGVYRRL